MHIYSANYREARARDEIHPYDRSMKETRAERGFTLYVVNFHLKKEARPLSRLRTEPAGFVGDCDGVWQRRNISTNRRSVLHPLRRV